MAWLAFEIGLFFGICFGVLIGVLLKQEDAGGDAESSDAGSLAVQAFDLSE